MIPKISVVVPVYRVEKYIHRCVDSILAQTFQNFRLILVDDGSPDRCGQICDEYKEKDSRIVVIHRKNGGLSAARNSGIDWVFQHEKTEWITFIDSDDWIHEQYLEALLTAAKEGGVDVSVCGSQRTSGESVAVSSVRYDIWKTEDFFLKHMTAATTAWGKLYRTDCFSKIRYPEGKLHEDEYTTYRILFQFSEVAFTAAPLYAYFMNSDGIMKSPWKPGRLDFFPAVAEQISFFQRRGLTELVKSRVMLYYYTLNDQMEALKQDPELYRVYYPKFRKMKAKLLRKWKNYFPRKQYIKDYEEAFPKTMHLFWTYQGIRHKLFVKK